MARTDVAMAPFMRKTGIKILGDLAWGTHFCQFYKTKQDLLDILVPYFKAGLENNELCVWVTSDFLDDDDARAAMKKAVPDFPKRLAAGQMEIFSYKNWYLKEGKFEMQRVLDQWIKKYDQGIKAGYDGCRVSGNPFWIKGKKDWKDFSEYEAEINNVIGPYKLLVLCTYSLDKCGASEILDVVNNHEFAVIKKFGDWAVVKSSASEKIQDAVCKTTLRYQALFNAMTESFALRELVFDAKGKASDCRFLDINPSFEKFIGLKRGQIVGKLRRDLPVDFNEQSFKIYARVVKTGKPAHFESFNRDLGKFFSVYVYRPAPNQFATIITDITDQKKAEEKIAQSERTYRGLFENIGEMLAIYRFTRGKDGRVLKRILVDGNRAMLEAAGVASIGEIRDKEMGEILGESYADATLGDIRKIIDSGKTGHFQSHNPKNGKSYINTITLLDENSYAAASKDITEIKKFEEALKISEERARTLVKYAPAMIYEMDFSGQRFISVNDVMCSMLGYPRKELMAMKPGDLIDEESREMFAQRIRQKLAGGEVPDAAEYRGLTKDGKEMYVSVKTTFTYKSGKPATAVVVAHDITERKKMEEEVTRTNSKLTQVLESIQDDFYVLDRGWNFVYANRQFASKVGKEPADFIGNNIWKMFPKHLGTAFEENCRATMEKREVRRFEIGGKYTNAWYRMTSFPSAEGITVLGTDITERKRMDAKIEKLASFPKLNPNPVIEMNLAGEIVYSNEAAARIVREESGKGIQVFLTKKIAKIISAAKKNAVEEVIWDEVNVGSRIFKESVHVIKNLGAVRLYAFDITDRKRMEVQLNKMNRTLWALSSSNQVLLHTDDETELLQKVCKIIVEDCGHAMVWIGYARNDEAKSVTPEAYAGFEKGYLEKLNVTWADNERGQGPTGRAIRTGEPQQCKNMLGDPQFKPWREEARRRGYASSLALPLKMAGKVLGAITIYSKKIDGFSSEEEVLLLSELADNLAYGIVSMRVRQENQKSEETLRETKEYLDNLLNYANAPIVVWDPEFKITRFNRAAEVLSGLKAEAIIGKKLDILFPKEARARIFKRLQETLEGHRWETVEIPIRRRDGSVRNVIWNSAAIFNDQGDRIEATIAQGQDITEEKIAQAALTSRTKELSRMVGDLKKLKLAVENASDIIFVTDPEGKIISINRAVESLLGHKARDVVGKTLAMFDSNADEEFYRRMWEEAAKQKRPLFREITNVRKNGQKAVFELHISPVMDNHGKIFSFIGIERDRTEAKAIDRAKTEFISMASHQLRTPLSTLSLTAQMILNGAIGSVDDPAREQIKEILNVADQMAALVDLLLNVSRIEMGRLAIDPQPMEIESFIKEEVNRIKPQAAKKNIKLQARIAAKLPIIDADRKVLDLAVENLLSNAVKYTPEGGRVTVAVEQTAAEMVLSVADTGIGIPENQVPMLFTKMFRASNVGAVKGIGLGLNMAKSIVEQSGGRMWFSSRPGKGSEFFIAIPLAGMKRKQIRFES